MSTRLLKGGRVLNPSTHLDDICDVLMDGETIVAIEKDIPAEKADDVIELTPKHWVTPGLIDIHVHFRDPGRSDKETTLTGAESAIEGGFTTVCIMPNTDPVIDSMPTLEYVLQAAKKVPIDIHPVPAATRGIEGKTITSMMGMVAKGAVAFTDDGHCIMNAKVMRLALEYSKMLNVPIMQHAEDYNLSGHGSMNEGPYSTKLGLSGHPNVAESTIVARDIELVRQTGGRLHVCHISTKEAVNLVRQAKTEGLNVTAEVTPHHISLTDAALEGYDPDFKMCPPLRSEIDRQAMIEGLKDGTIDVIATDHAPHTPEEKALALDEAPNGVVGLETAVGVALTHLVEPGLMTPLEVIQTLTLGPAKIMNLSAGRLEVGQRADVTVIDPELAWVVNPSQFKSKSRNSCFKGMTLKGKAVMTFFAGECLMDHLREALKPVSSAPKSMTT